MQLHHSCKPHGVGGEKDAWNFTWSGKLKIHNLMERGEEGLMEPHAVGEKKRHMELVGREEEGREFYEDEEEKENGVFLTK